MLEQDWLTTTRAAHRLGVSAERVRQLLSAGRIAHVRTPLGRLLDPADVERLATERRRSRSTPDLESAL